MADESNIVELISDFLSSGNVRNVKEIINKDSFTNTIKEKTSDIILIASYYLSDQKTQENPAVSRCCKKLITKCAEHGNPKECLIEFLAQIESLDETKFNVFLEPIQAVLLRIPGSKGGLLQSAVDVIYSYVNSLPVPQYHHFDQNSRILLDNDDNTVKITDTYNLILKFYEPLVNQFCSEKPMKTVLIQGLFHLLGIPIIYLDLETRDNGDSPIRDIVLRNIIMISKLQKDPVQLLLLVENKLMITVDEENVSNDSTSDVKMTNISLSVFFYLIFYEKVAYTIPSIYSKLFIFRNCLRLAMTLLQYQETLVLKKGLLLTKATIEQIEPGSVEFTYLADDVHKTAFKLLSNIAVFHDEEDIRRLAIELFKEHLFIFSNKAKFTIFLNINIEQQHPNIIGFLMTLLTRLVQYIFVDNCRCEYFTGKRLFDLLKKFCSLRKGVETDLVENKDQIMSALNLIIYLTKRDGNNVSGIWDYVDLLSQRLLLPLREGIDLSRAHYKLKIKNLDDPLKNEDGGDFSVSVGGLELDNMSNAEKKSVLNMGLTVFDLIEHLLIRATECIENKSLIQR